MKNILITGANRGLGLGFVKKFLEKNVKVFCTTRNLSKSDDLMIYKKKYPHSLEIFEVNLLDENSSNLLSNFLVDEPIDIFINNAGVIGDSSQHFKAVSLKPWLEVLKVNLIAPLIITQSIIKNIEKSSDKKIYFLSSKVGSIEDNRGGGMYIYRSSKTALNQVVKSLSVDLKPLGISVISLHPGWVRTDMGGPNALISVDESVNGMMTVISNTDIKNSGQFLNYDGNEIPW
ncbi:MAG: SDR family oxidoreductase [Paracoccaceae bacterium]